VSQLVTGEAVALDLRPAALPSRIVAGIVDLAVQGLVLVVFAALSAAAALDLSSAAEDALGILLLVLVLIAYPVTFETLLRGRTPGKAVMGLRAVRDDGGPIGFRHALVRGLTGAFLERPGITLFFGAVVTSLLNPQGKRLGDLLAGTVVVRERVSGSARAGVVMPPTLAPWAATLDLRAVSDDLALSVRQFLSRAPDLTAAARDDLGARLVGAVVEAVGPPPPGTPGWAVLAAVLAERRRRETERWSQPGGPREAPAAPPRRVDDAPAGRVDDGPPARADEAGPGGFVAPS
jgi:uncharacterized RDD family membrane protein YckC